MRARLGGAADSLTLEEIAALQRNYPSDDTASMVSIVEGESSAPSWVPAAAIAKDPISVLLSQLLFLRLYQTKTGTYLTLLIG